MKTSICHYNFVVDIMKVYHYESKVKPSNSSMVHGTRGWLEWIKDKEEFTMFILKRPIMVNMATLEALGFILEYS